MAVEEPAQFGTRHPLGVDDDAVRVIDGDGTGVPVGQMHLDRKGPIHVGSVGLHRVRRAVPTLDGQPGLLDNLSSEPLQNRLTLVDDPAGGTPVGAATATTIVNHQHRTPDLDDAAANRPSSHNCSLPAIEGGCSRHARLYDDAVATDDLSPPADDPVALSDFAAPTALPSTLARALAFGSVIVAAVCGGLVGFAIADLQCIGNCDGWSLLGAASGALVASIGTAVIAVLVLRAMAEWENQASVRAR